jgi:hypothetical protein
LLAILREIGPTPERAAYELMVLKRFRRADISGGRAAELLGISRLDLIQRAGEVGSPFASYSEDEWDEELRTIETLASARNPSATPAR